MATAMTGPRREPISAMAAGLIGSGYDDASSRSYCRLGSSRAAREWTIGAAAVEAAEGGGPVA